MGVSDQFDEMAEKTTGAAGGKDKINRGLDEAADAVDKKTGGKASPQIKKGARSAKEEVNEWADDDDEVS